MALPIVTFNLEPAYQWPVIQPRGTYQLQTPQTEKNYAPCANCVYAHEKCFIEAPYSSSRCRKCAKQGRKCCPPHMPRTEAGAWKKQERLNRATARLDPPGDVVNEPLQSISTGPIYPSGANVASATGYSTGLPPAIGVGNSILYHDHYDAYGNQFYSVSSDLGNVVEPNVEPNSALDNSVHVLEERTYQQYMFLNEESSTQESSYTNEFMEFLPGI